MRYIRRRFAYEKKFWNMLCSVLGLKEWADRQWAEGKEEEALRAAVAGAFAEKTLDEWMALFDENEACVTPVLSLREVLDTDHIKERGTVIEVDDPNQGRTRHIALPIRFDGVKLGSTSPAPGLDADGEALTAELEVNRPGRGVTVRASTP